jgi:hypothetical protein
MDMDDAEKVTGIELLPSRIYEINIISFLVTAQSGIYFNHKELSYSYNPVIQLSKLHCKF